MINEQVEYMVLSGSTAKAIMTKTGAKLADVKYVALQLKREGVINEEEAQKYFDAQSIASTTKAPKTDTPAKRRGRPAAKKESEEKEETPEGKKPGRRRRPKNAN